MIVVRTTDELTALRSGRLRARRGTLRLELAGLTDDEARSAATRLSALQNECGCRVGALLAYPTTVAVVIWQVASSPPWATTLTTRIASSAAIIIAAGMLGKGIGVLRARRTFAREIDTLRQRILESAASP
jgi:hypothetical protein